MSVVAWCTEHNRALFWVAATDSFILAVMSEWQRVDPTDVHEHIPAAMPFPSARYSVIFEATCNSVVEYDPIIQARSVRFDIVTSAKRWSPQSDNKIRKVESAEGPREPTAVTAASGCITNHTRTRRQTRVGPSTASSADRQGRGSPGQSGCVWSKSE